jgi:hypothetical protein
MANSRLIAFDHSGVTFHYKDYRADGCARYKRMTLATHEFIRRFLLHVLPDGFHRIRHYGLFASASRADNIARARELLAAPTPQTQADDADAVSLSTVFEGDLWISGRIVWGNEGRSPSGILLIRSPREGRLSLSFPRRRDPSNVPHGVVGCQVPCLS